MEIEKQIDILLAGWASNIVFSPYSYEFLGCENDIKKAYELLTGKTIDPCAIIAWIIQKDQPDIFKTFEYRRGPLSYRIPRNIVSGFKNIENYNQYEIELAAKTLLKKVRFIQNFLDEADIKPAVQSLAKKLIQRKIIAGSEAAKIMRRASGWARLYQSLITLIRSLVSSQYNIVGLKYCFFS